MFKQWSKYFGAVAALVLVGGLALIVMMVGANFLQSFMATALKDSEWMHLNTVQSTYTVRSIMNFYYVLCGILFLGFFVLMEHRLITTGVPKKLVLRRTAFTLGIELLILALFQLAMMTYLRVVALQVGLAVIEVLLGVGLIYFGRRKMTTSRN